MDRLSRPVDAIDYNAKLHLLLRSDTNMTKLNKSSYVVLGLLCKSDYSGYDLKMLMSKIAAFYWSESNAQIYPTLKKLEIAKLLTSSLDETSGARQRRLYSITSEGKAALMEWLHELSDMTPYREEFLLKLSLGQFLMKEAQLAHLKHYQTQLQNNIAEHRIIMEHVDIDHAGRDDQVYLQHVHQHVADILQTKLAWCEKMLESFENTQKS